MQVPAVAPLDNKTKFCNNESSTNSSRTIMGKSSVVPYIANMVEIINGRKTTTTLTYRGNRPTQSKFEEFVMSYIKSLNPGGSNFHISQSYNCIPNVVKAELIGQKNGLRLNWSAPMFMVI